MEIERRVYNRMVKLAERRVVQWELDYPYFKELIRRRCSYCGSLPSNQFRRGEEVLLYSGIDRVNSALGYVDGNVVPCCRYCNVLKSAQPPSTWFDFLKGVIVTHDGEVPKEWMAYEDRERPTKAPNFWSRPGKR